MSTPEIKGWCPGAYTPMQSGDGLILRVRPHMGRLSRMQVLGLCDAARAHANGYIDLTNRANLQVRGVRAESYEPLLAELLELDLLDPDPAHEARRNMTVTPFLQAGDMADQLGHALISRLDELPTLPAKFGFAVDCGPEPVLAGDPADIRIERSASSGIVVRADGCDWARAVDPGQAVDAAIEMAHWFADHADNDHRRMAALADLVPDDWQQELPLPGAAPSRPGQTRGGMMLGVAFGSMNATALEELMAASGAGVVVMTPWRMMFLPGVAGTRRPGFISDPGDPMLRASACPGAPSCAQASVETRRVAAVLAPGVAGDLHVSGCAKGCAHPRAASVTLVGSDGAFDLVRQGCSWDEPQRRRIAPQDLMDGTESV